MVFVILALTTALFASAACLFLFKRDLKNINRQLAESLFTETNARLITATFDKDIGELVVHIDNMRDKHQKETVAYRRAEQRMKQAITNVSHDLRTPLTASLGYLQLMASDQTSEEKRKAYARIIEERLKVLSSHLNQLFEFTRIAEGRGANTSKLNVCNLLRDSLADYYEHFDRQGFAVDADIPDAPVYIVADQDDIRRIFQNVLQNALLHGTAYFHVRVDPENNAILFANRVKDIALLDVEAMFERFYTSDLARTKQGTGLGLAIVKALLDGMGGSVSAAIEGDLLSIQIRF